MILDLFSRLVVGWAMAATEDSGTEFTSDRYQAALRDLGIELISMSRTGNCWDNAAMESVRRCAFFLLVGRVQPH